MNVLSRQLELLYHLSFVSFGRQHLFRSFIVQQLPNTLQENEWLISSALVNKHLFNGDVGVVGYSLMLLYNLAYEKQIFTMLKQSELEDVCLPLHDAKDVTIQFASTTLSKILHEEKIDENNNPVKLKAAYIEFLDNIIIKSNQETKSGARRYVEGMMKMFLETHVIYFWYKNKLEAEPRTGYACIRLDYSRERTSSFQCFPLFPHNSVHYFRLLTGFENLQIR
jgi:hypothetical protein